MPPVIGPLFWVLMNLEEILNELLVVHLGVDLPSLLGDFRPILRCHNSRYRGARVLSRVMVSDISAEDYNGLVAD